MARISRVANVMLDGNPAFVHLAGANGKLQVFPLSMLGPVFEAEEVGPLKMRGYHVFVMTGLPPQGATSIEVYRGEGDSLIKALGGDVPK